VPGVRVIGRKEGDVSFVRRRVEPFSRTDGALCGRGDFSRGKQAGNNGKLSGWLEVVEAFRDGKGARSMVAIIREDLTLRVIGAKVGIVIRKVEDLNGKINDMKAKLVYLNIQISNIKCKLENHNY
jgi:hypothetical protein